MAIHDVCKGVVDVLAECDNDVSVSELAFRLHKRGVEQPRSKMMDDLWQLVSDGMIDVDSQFHVSLKGKGYARCKQTA